MRPEFIPEPHAVRLLAGCFDCPSHPAVALSKPELEPVAAALDSLFGATQRAPADRADIDLRLRRNLSAEGYELTIRPDRVRLAGGSPAGVRAGLRTLAQLTAQSDTPRRLRCLEVRDRPDLPCRGIYYDVARGRVPDRAALLQMAEGLAAHKINQLQLYLEHTFRFAAHPAIGRRCSPLTPDDILALDAHCRSLGIVLVPSLACFGHLAAVLRHPQYRHLAEDWGVGRYVAPEAGSLPAWKRRRGWSLAPANPDTYRFLDSLFAEFLPLFSSEQFNVCCDETWDLGLGQSYALCRRRGRGRVYLDHLLALRRLASRYGKRIMFWGDIIRGYPELVSRIPDDVTVLDWGYTHDHPFDRLRDFRRAAVPFYACPGTSSWVSLFPRLPEAQANIAGFARAAVRHRARGLLVTDWGDGGHYNFNELSWHGYLFGAEQAWNADADPADFTARFARLFLRSRDRALPGAIARLGDVAHLGVAGRYQSAWLHIFFAAPGSDLFDPVPRDASVARRGRIAAARVRLDAALGRRTRRDLSEIRDVLDRVRGEAGTDPRGVLPYWLFAVDTLHHAARKLAVLGHGGSDTRRARRTLARDQAELMERFETLWRARNRPSEIRLTLKRYRRTIGAMRQ